MPVQDHTDGPDEGWTVGEVAGWSGTSVRALHHYDEVGLLRPSRRSTGNHRLYGEAELERLRRILFYRELDFDLASIARILDQPGTDAGDHLRRQHALLRDRLNRTGQLIDALEEEIHARKMGISLSPLQQLQIFGTERFASLLAEAGRNPVMAEVWDSAARRSAAYTPADWSSIRAEADATIDAFVQALAAGDAPTSPRARAAAEDHRRHLSRWFFDCDHHRHARIAAVYLSDPAGIGQWDNVAPGFSQYVYDAINANARPA